MPRWFLVLVVVALLALGVLAGFLLRGLIGTPRPTDPQTVALAEAERAVEADPDDPSALVDLGYAYQQLGRYADALESYDAALEADPANVGAQYNRGAVLFATGRSAEAEKALLRLLKMSPDHVLATKMLAEYYAAEGTYERVLDVVEPALVLRPQYADLQYLAGLANEKLDRPDAAIGYYRAALEYSPDHVEARSALANLEGR